MERETGFEPATSTLARSHSTTELLPLVREASIIAEAGIVLQIRRCKCAKNKPLRARAASTRRGAEICSRCNQFRRPDRAEMSDILLRFFIGGLVVSAFAALGDVLKPKSFAGLFGAAPSVALATLGLTTASESARYAATEARSMVAGAIAFFAYASLVSALLMRARQSALAVTMWALPLWLGIDLALWWMWLR